MGRTEGDVSTRRVPMRYVVGFFAVWGGLCDVLLDAPAGAARHVVIAYLIRGLVSGGVTGYCFARTMRWLGHA